MKSLVQIRRMEIHANFLQALPRRSFNICDIASKTECGTVACVAGWIPFVPQFRKAGFSAKLHNHEDFELIVFKIYFKGEEVYNILDDAQKFFGLTAEERGELFYEDGYSRGMDATPKDAARKLRKFIAAARKERIKAGLSVEYSGGGHIKHETPIKLRTKF